MSQRVELRKAQKQIQCHAMPANSMSDGEERSAMGSGGGVLGSHAACLDLVDM